MVLARVESLIHRSLGSEVARLTAEAYGEAYGEVIVPLVRYIAFMTRKSVDYAEWATEEVGLLWWKRHTGKLRRDTSVRVELFKLARKWARRKRLPEMEEVGAEYSRKGRNEACMWEIELVRNRLHDNCLEAVALLDMAELSKEEVCQVTGWKEEEVMEYYHEAVGVMMKTLQNSGYRGGSEVD